MTSHAGEKGDSPLPPASKPHSKGYAPQTISMQKLTSTAAASRVLFLWNGDKNIGTPEGRGAP
eukprot:scaffold7381_cov310-Pinguiococcus_pyrenoidosus.AAC.96